MARGLPRRAARRGFQGGAAPLVAGRGFMPRPRRGGRASDEVRRPLEGVFPSKLTPGCDFEAKGFLPGAFFPDRNLVINGDAGEEFSNPGLIPPTSGAEKIVEDRRQRHNLDAAAGDVQGGDGQSGAARAFDRRRDNRGPWCGPLAVASGRPQNPVHFFLQNFDDGLDGLSPGLVQSPATLDSGDAFGRRDFGHDKACRGFGRIPFCGPGRAFQPAPVHRDGGIKAGEGSLPLASRQKQRETKSNAVSSPGFMQDPKGGQSGHGSFSHLFARTGDDARFFFGKFRHGDPPWNPQTSKRPRAASTPSPGLGRGFVPRD